jgi:hypothetical protein
MFPTYGGVTYGGVQTLGAPAGLSGSGTLTFATVPAFTATRTLSGSGTLTFAATPAFAVARAFTGSGSLSLSAVPSVPVALALSGSGTLSLVGANPAFAVTAGLSGSGSLTLAGANPTFAVALGLSGSGALSFTTTPAFVRPLALSGSGALTFTATPAFARPLGLSGSGTLTLAAAAAFADARSLSGAGSLTLSAVPSVPVALALSGSGTLSLAGSAPAFAVARALSGDGALTFAATPAFARSLALTGSGALSLAASPAFAVARALSGSGTLTLAGANPTFAVPLALSGSGTLTFTVVPAFAVARSLSGSGALTFTATPAFARPLGLSGSGSLTFTTVPAFTVARGLSGSGTLSLLGENPAFAVALPLTGSGTLTYAVTPAFAVTRALTGSGTLTFAATPVFAVARSLSGSGTLTFTTVVPAFAVGLPLTGAGSLTFVPVPRFTGTLNLSGTGTNLILGGVQFSSGTALSGSGQLVNTVAGFGVIDTCWLTGDGALSLTGLVYETPSVFVPLPGTSAIVTNRALPWRYVFADLLTDATIDEFELLDVRFDTRINQPGAFSATYPMTKPEHARKGRQIAEGRSVCYVYRGVEVYAGPYIIWGLNVGSDPRGARKLSMQGAGLESYFNRREIRTSLDFVQVDQLQIARTLITAPQADPRGDVRVEVDNATSGVLRDRREWTAASASTYGGRLSDLAAVENGFEFRILSYVDWETRERVRRFVTGYPHLGRPETEHVFTYPGRVVGWVNNRDATAGATSFRSRGDTPISEELTEALDPVMSDVVDREDLLEQGWPLIDRTDDYSSVITKAVLDEHTRENAAIYGGSADIFTATVRLDPTGAGDFHPNDLGSSARLIIQDDYLGLLNTVWRVVGMDVRPSTRGQQDTADLIFEVAGV